jgi:methylenetetrahydrofolate dehydrogenase (NADP+)/methenyltetrahydrofolate cyclohydrolase
MLKDIKEFCKEWKASLRDRLNGKAATLYIIQVGDNEASNRYVRNKIKDCEEIGIEAQCIKLPENITTDEMVKIMVKTYIGKLHVAMIVQLPLPEHLDVNHIIGAIPRGGDVDGVRPLTTFTPCTPLGIMKYLEHCDYDLEGKNVTIIGRSDIVGKPLAKLMTDANATVTLCHSKTKNLWTHIETADLIISAVGKHGVLNCYAIHKPVIDVGINFIEDESGKPRLVGDCINTENREVTPVPGGVGLLTRCALLENIVRMVEEQNA